MNNFYNTKYITEGAILTALFLVLALITYFTPLFLFSFIILPTPYIVLLVRTSYRIFILSALAGGALLFLFIDPLFALVITLTAWTMGGTLGYAFKQKWSAPKNLLVASITVLAIFLIFFTLMQIILSIDIIEELAVTFEQVLQNQISTLQNMGAPEDQIQELQNIEEVIREQVRVFVPSAIIAFAIISGYLQVLINGKILSKLKFDVIQMPAFRDWRLPAVFTGFFVISSVLLVFQADLHGYWGMLAANLFVVSNYILLIQGLSFGFWFLKEHKQLSTLLVGVVIALVLVIPFFNMAIVVIGIMDQMLNLRAKVNEKS